MKTYSSFKQAIVCNSGIDQFIVLKTMAPDIVFSVALLSLAGYPINLKNTSRTDDNGIDTAILMKNRSTMMNSKTPDMSNVMIIGRSDHDPLMDIFGSKGPTSITVCGVFRNIINRVAPIFFKEGSETAKFANSIGKSFDTMPAMVNPNILDLNYIFSEFNLNKIERESEDADKIDNANFFFAVEIAKSILERIITSYQEL